MGRDVPSPKIWHTIVWSVASCRGQHHGPEFLMNLPLNDVAPGKAPTNANPCFRTVIGNSAVQFGISRSRKKMPHHKKGLELVEKALRELQAARSISANTLLRAASVLVESRLSEPPTSLMPQTAKEST